MPSYLINKKKSIKEIKSIQDIDGYQFEPNLDNKDLIKVTKVTVVDKKMIDKILSMKFERYFRRLVMLAKMLIENDDSTDDDADLVLDEAKLVKEILENRYKKYLGYEKEQLFLKKVKIIENQVQMKKIEIKKRIIYMEMQERMNRSRGM